MTTTVTSKRVRDDSDERELWLCALDQLGACSNAVAWLHSMLATGTVDEAWATCPRGDWLLWLIGRIDDVSPSWSDERKPLVRAACDCARLALPHTNDALVLRCIEVTEAWCRGEATIDEVRAAASADAAADAAYAAASAASAAYAAAYDAAYAAAYDAAYAASAAAYAASAAAYAAYAADAVVARTRNHAQCADLVRRHYPRPPALL